MVVVVVGVGRVGNSSVRSGVIDCGEKEGRGVLHVHAFSHGINRKTRYENARE